MKWSVQSMNVLPEYEKLENVVINVNWKLFHSEKLGEFDSNYSFSGMTVIEPIVDNSFVPYEDLTENQVVNFVKQTIGDNTVQVYENFVLNMAKNMDKVMLPTKQLPWML